MLVKYVESFRTLEHGNSISLVVSECSSLRLVPDLSFEEGVKISLLFLYRDNAPSLFIPFESTNCNIQYVENLLDLSLSRCVIDLSGFKALKTSEFEALTKAINSQMHGLPVGCVTGHKAIDDAISYNNESFEDVARNISNGGDF